MNQLLAKPALVERVLALERRGRRSPRGGCLGVMGANIRWISVSDGQALQEESQQQEGRHHLRGGAILEKAYP